MELLAINERWAVFDDCGDECVFDPVAALRDLLKIKKYSHLIDFLINHSRNSAFTIASDTPYFASFKTEDLGCFTQPLGLAGNIVRTVDSYSEIDLLDDFSKRDLAPLRTREIILSELLSFREDMARLLTLAAIANGASMPDGLFRKTDPVALFGEDWCGDSLPCAMEELNTFSIRFEDCAIGYQWAHLFDESILLEGHGILNHLDKYSSYQMASASSQEFGAYTDRYPFSIDGVIYSIDEHYPDTWPEDKNDIFWGVSVTFPPGFDETVAKRLLAARIVETLINYGPYWSDTSFSLPSIENDAFDKYGFSLDHGFFTNENKFPVLWFEELYEAAVSLILNNKIALCSVCGSPILVLDSRGRKPREMCSATCKTIASNQRREQTIALFAKGLPLEQIVKEIGEDYRSSILRWCNEAQSIITKATPAQ